MDILSGSAFTHTEDVINTSAIFGGIQRTIISKNFKGGKIKNVCSSTELDFTHADIHGIVELEISQAFAEVTIAVPADWRVEADIDHICSAIEEDRSYSKRGYNSEKVLRLKGLSVLSSVNVVSCL